MDFEIARDDLHRTRIADGEPAVLADGQARLAVSAFGLTANNITYAVFGETMSYWDFFPAEDGWAHVPVWGFANVVARNCRILFLHQVVRLRVLVDGFRERGSEASQMRAAIRIGD